ncbi:MAG: cobalamin-dependent protein, partial [Chloroflexota bacterium]|nr:cobalamin-dependent protein [Chloroflexota bacterium]
MPDSTEASARTQGARVLLLSTYEMGHQPVGLAAPAAALRARGHHVDVIDLGVDPLDEARVGVADLIALSIPMHTPARLAQQLIPRLRALRPDVPIALYGLYAGLLGDLRTSGVVDAVAGGEYEPALCDLADRVASGDGIDGFDAPDAAFVRQDYPVPDRTGLPALDRYAQLQTEHGFSVAGYVEATRGCAHQCLHCPVTAAYDGRLRLVAPEVVLADIDQQVAAGAAHITFGDPDFLNAVPHSLAIAEGLHDRHPELSFDFTAKVEHLLEQADLLPRLRELGCLFVTSAFEATSD